MNMHSPAGASAWRPDRSRPAPGRPKMGVARTPVNRRPPEGQAAFRARVEAQRFTAEREAPVRETGSVDDQWEAYRKDAEAQGDIFDARGYVTKDGQDRLRKAGLGSAQVTYLENLQRNHVAEVTIVSKEEARDGGPRMSAQERATVSDRAQTAAQEALRARAEADVAARVRTDAYVRDAETRTREVGRMQAGARAYMNAVGAGMTDADARRAQADAERAFDLKVQQARGSRSAL